MTNADIVITVAKVLGNKNSRDGIFVPGSESYHGELLPWGAKILGSEKSRAHRVHHARLQGWGLSRPTSEMCRSQNCESADFDQSYNRVCSNGM